MGVMFHLYTDYQRTRNEHTFYVVGKESDLGHVVLELAANLLI
jgi:hypothetical protein